ncbi:diadenylate cyclase CdaA [Companilactobacillus sp.]|jgi:diadenylate cyclase|uniref:diadenylate cyclase CdaA n=1 Tax=Companilactobacillus sp. TaxID=2767905 RepID=UPI0025B8AC26|nr:diadenylate cyclase CdaA [Companilactobacillus sp.]MCH4008748.1 diadenylate cyclase CdaA [Companilactobacillus sp.]MCH4051073.1 diadenylate cyclase CdaA [Companilactobacillus sp.]MCH4076691.1 diadenylate cyclase CdaA [Companilactobacillus sp.]MCH4125266.1 diadenylate cyclase CdaA [Companilactobacillus sp.]MCH4131806.1 diadenylate cyclase CdaA [Companilactobacillus sp.]
MNLTPSNIFTLQNLANLADILVVWYVLYKVLSMIRGTKAVQLLKGIVVIFLIKIISWALNLHTVSFLMDQLINWGVIIIVVIFQPEIRRGLEHLGRMPFFSSRSNEEGKTKNHLIESLDQAIQYMSKRRIGALITLEMNTGLEEYVETGIDLDAEVTGALLINIFIPNTPLHDGAVIIRKNRISVAAAYLPLSESNTIPKELGTRHRAAVGISEVTDSITIVVSEETGGVMITRNGHMMLDLSREDYLKYLHAQLSEDGENENHSISDIFRVGRRKKGGDRHDEEDNQ